jgi:hypothetical protein
MLLYSYHASFRSVCSKLLNSGIMALVIPGGVRPLTEHLIRNRSHPADEPDNSQNHNNRSE